MKKLFECIPNYSEGRRSEVIESIVDCFRGKEGVKLLDYQTDSDHNRLVITAIGEAKPLKEAVLKSCEVAIEKIDLNKHEGQHPRMGAIDVVPFVPCRNSNIEEADALAKEVGQELGNMGVPVFLYEDSATKENRVNLAEIRKGQFEGMAEKLKDLDNWKSDFGPVGEIHPTAGVSAVGARMPLIAFNINLNTSDIEIAKRIAKTIRHSSGGYRYLKAIGVNLSEENIAQVSINMVNYEKTAMYRAFEAVKMEAQRYGVSIRESEVVGLLPMQALIDSACYYLQINDDFDAHKQVMENRLLEEENNEVE